MQEGTQGKLEDLFSPRKVGRVDVDPKRIEADLRDYAGHTPFKLHIKPHSETRVSVREMDKLVDIVINPRRIRTREQLDQVMQVCQSSLRLV